MSSNDEDEDICWTEVKVKLLLTLYLVNIEDFRKFRHKKRHVWQKIANELDCTVDACDRKFRNLKCYYVNILRRKSAQNASSWPYFQILEEIFRNDPTLQINKNKIDSDTNSSDADVLSDCSFREVFKPTNISSMTAAEYPRNKMKRSCLSNDLQNDELIHNNRKRFRKTNMQDSYNSAIRINRTYETISSTLDKLITQIDQSNKIQAERNKLFQKYYAIIKPS